MSLFGNTEHKPTDNVEAPVAVSREVVEPAGERAVKVALAVARANAASLYMEKTFPAGQKLNNFLATTAPAAQARPVVPIENPVITTQVAEDVDNDFIDGLENARYNPADNLIDENQRRSEQAAQARQAEAAARRAPAFEPAPMKSPYNMPVEAGMANPNINNVVYADNLYNAMAQPDAPEAEMQAATPEAGSLDLSAVQQRVRDAYDLAA